MKRHYDFGVYGLDENSENYSFCDVFNDLKHVDKINICKTCKIFNKFLFTH